MTSANGVWHGVASTWSESHVIESRGRSIKEETNHACRDEVLRLRCREKPSEVIVTRHTFLGTHGGSTRVYETGSNARQKPREAFGTEHGEVVPSEDEEKTFVLCDVPKNPNGVPRVQSGATDNYFSPYRAKQAALRKFSWNEFRIASSEPIKGKTAQIYAATLLDTGQRVAIKVFKRKHYVDYRNELAAMQRLPRHPNVVCILGKLAEPGKSGIALEWCEGGDLEDYLTGLDGCSISAMERLGLLIQIAKGINIFHSLPVPIIHRDLKPDNILVAFDGTGSVELKIADFGFAHEEGEKPFRACAGTRPYAAPEIVSRKFSASPKADVFGFGLILRQMLTTDAIDETALRKTFLEKVLIPRDAYSPSIRSSLIPGVPREAFKLIRKCCKINPCRRPPIWSVLKELCVMYERVRFSRISRRFGG